MGMYGGSGDAAAESRALESERQARIEQGVAAVDADFSQFDDNFYQTRANDYEKYATPIFQNQYQQSKSTLAQDLARRGLLNSGAAVRAGKSLQTYANQQTQAIANQGMNQANQLRGEVAQQRANLVSQVVASGDPNMASNAALTSATAQLHAPQGYAPIGNMFNDWTNMWMANQRANVVNGTTVGNQPMFSFGRPNNSQSIVN